MKLTDRTIRALKPKRDRYEVWEDNGKGFGLRISPRERKSWIFLYRFDGKARRMTLGEYPEVTLADAHAKHAHARKLLEQGIDPGDADQAAKAERRQAPTVAHLATEYLEKHAKPNKRSWREDERILNKDVLVQWGRRKARDIKKRDVVILLDVVLERGAPIAANRTLAVIRKMFSFAVGRDILDASPCVAIAAPAPENRRDRVLTEREIHTFWTTLDEARMTEPMRLALRLQLATAQRKGEVTIAEWSEFDLGNKVWTIPAAKSKNKLTHRVPLSPLALQILKQLKRISGDSRWLFPSPHGDKPVIATVIDHAVRKNREVFGIASFTPHDLRRTAASHMTSVGISRLVVSKILNHVESGVTAVYDRHSYDIEKRHALEMWARKLNTIVAGETAKVIPLRSGS